MKTISDSAEPGDRMVATIVHAHYRAYQQTKKPGFSISNSKDPLTLIKVVALAKSLGLRPRLTSQCKRAIKAHIANSLAPSGPITPEIKRKTDNIYRKITSPNSDLEDLE